MEHYCPECDGYHKPQKFDGILGLCKRCAKPFNKRHKSIERIMAHYSDVSVGDLMWWGRQPVMVVHIHPNGWEVVHTKTGKKEKIIVNMFDVIENLALTFRKFRDGQRN